MDFIKKENKRKSFIEKSCLKWNDFKKNVNDAFCTTRDNIDLTDITLAFEDGQQLVAHKVVLAASIPFFQNMLERNQHPHQSIFMIRLKSEDMTAMIDFVDDGEIKINKEDLPKRPTNKAIWPYCLESATIAL